MFKWVRKKMLDLKGWKPGRKKKKWIPGAISRSWVMGEFLSIATGIKKESVQAMFSRHKKKLSNLNDCRERLYNRFMK